MSVFKRRRLPVEVISLCVRWYCKYGISYRDLADMMQERGVMVDHTTIFRWVQRYAPKIEKRVRWYQGYRSPSWRVDETYVRVGGAWNFLGKVLKTMRNWLPISITTDKLGCYRQVIRCLQRDGRLSHDVTHRTLKYLNNIVEADHGALKQVIRPSRGFQTMKTAYATIKGFEIMRMIRRGHCICRVPGTAGEVRFVNKLFGLLA